MPGKRIPDLPAIAGASTANDDNLVIYDTDAGTTKRILRSQLAAGLVGDLPYTPAGFISATTVPTAIAEVASDLAASSGASLVGYTQGGSGAATRTVQSKLWETVSIFDYIPSSCIPSKLISRSRSYGSASLTPAAGTVALSYSLYLYLEGLGFALLFFG